MGSKSDPQDAVEPIEQVQENLLALEDLELIESGEPVEFTVGQRKFALRQPDANEYELTRLWESIGYHEAMTQEGMDAMKALPVSEATTAARIEQIAELRETLKASDDPKRRREIDKQLRRLERPDTRNRAQELAESYSYRYRDIQMIKRLLVTPEGERIPQDEIDKLLRTPVFVDVARIACYRIIKMMLTLPNWIERTASEQD